MLREGVEWTVTPKLMVSLSSDPAVSQPLSFPAALPGAHNRSNIGAALTAVQTLIGDRSLADKVISDVLSSIRIPGRFDRRIDDVTGRRLILDERIRRSRCRMLVETMRAVVVQDHRAGRHGVAGRQAGRGYSCHPGAGGQSESSFRNERPRIVPAELLRAIAQARW